MELTFSKNHEIWCDSSGDCYRQIKFIKLFIKKLNERTFPTYKNDTQLKEDNPETEITE